MRRHDYSYPVPIRKELMQPARDEARRRAISLVSLVNEALATHLKAALPKLPEYRRYSRPGVLSDITETTTAARRKLGI